MGKGDSRRPTLIPKEQADANWDAVFGKKLNVMSDEEREAALKEQARLAEREPYWTGPGYRGEYSCPHGVGHGNHVHGCCEEHCCSRDDYPLKGKEQDESQ